MLFKQLDNQKIEKKNYTITINNIEAGGGHWNNEKYIEKLFANFQEQMLYEKDNFNNQVCKFATNIIKNYRVEDILFYREGDKLILLAISNVPNFKETEIFTRFMEVAFRGQPQTFAVNEITSKEWFKVGKGEIKMPETWVLDEALTNRFGVLQSLL